MKELIFTLKLDFEHEFIQKSIENLKMNEYFQSCFQDSKSDVVELTAMHGNQWREVFDDDLNKINIENIPANNAQHKQPGSHVNQLNRFARSSAHSQSKSSYNKKRKKKKNLKALMGSSAQSNIRRPVKGTTDNARQSNIEDLNGCYSYFLKTFEGNLVLKNIFGKSLEQMQMSRGTTPNELSDILKNFFTHNFRHFCFSNQYYSLFFKKIILGLFMNINDSYFFPTSAALNTPHHASNCTRLLQDSFKSCLDQLKQLTKNVSSFENMAIKNSSKKLFFTYFSKKNSTLKKEKENAFKLNAGFSTFPPYSLPPGTSFAGCAHQLDNLFSNFTSLLRLFSDFLTFCSKHFSNITSQQTAQNQSILKTFPTLNKTCDSVRRDNFTCTKNYFIENLNKISSSVDALLPIHFVALVRVFYAPLTKFADYTTSILFCLCRAFSIKRNISNEMRIKTNEFFLDVSKKLSFCVENEYFIQEKQAKRSFLRLKQFCTLIKKFLNKFSGKLKSQNYTQRKSNMKGMQTNFTLETKSTEMKETNTLSNSEAITVKLTAKHRSDMVNKHKKRYSNNFQNTYQKYMDSTNKSEKKFADLKKNRSKNSIRLCNAQENISKKRWDV